METPMEAAILRAHDLVAGLAALAQLQNMIAASDAAKALVHDRDEPFDARVAALKEARHLNLIFATVAEARAVCGIEA